MILLILITENKLHEVYAGDSNITEFEGNHNSERPQFFYESGAIFFSENVFKWDSTLNTKNLENASILGESNKTVSKQLKIENSNCEILNGELIELDPNRMFNIEEKNKYFISGWRNNTLESTVNKKDSETEVKMHRSMTTVTEESERDQWIIDFFHKISYFKNLPHNLQAIYEIDNLPNKDNINTEDILYEKQINDAINHHLIGNIPDEEIASIKTMLFNESSETETQTECIS